MLRRCAAGVSKRELRHFMLMCKVDSDPGLSYKELAAALKESERVRADHDGNNTPCFVGIDRMLVPTL